MENVVYTQHFAERFLQRVNSSDHRDVLKKLKETVKGNLCVLVFECCLDHRQQTKIKIGKGYVATARFNNVSKKLFVTTIYKR